MEAHIVPRDGDEEDEIIELEEVVTDVEEGQPKLRPKSKSKEKGGQSSGKAKDGARARVKTSRAKRTEVKPKTKRGGRDGSEIDGNGRW